MHKLVSRTVRRLYSGSDMVMKHSANGTMDIIFKRGSSRSNDVLSLSQEQYEPFMQEFLSTLYDYHDNGGTVEIKMDYYGAKWIEVRSGFIWRRKSRISIAPRFIDALQTRLTDTDVATMPEADITTHR